MGNYYVYILSNRYRTVYYIGVTNDLDRRVAEHRQGIGSGFTSKYRCKDLVYYEWFWDINHAIRREKQLKGWRRSKKLDLIQTFNPKLNHIDEAWLRRNPDKRF